ncbi:MAG: DUF4900 domain-containing protein [Candidatus Omnitrophota bacterium]
MIKMANKRGVVLVVSLIVMTILLVLTGVYFLSLMTEKKSADSEEFTLQALGLAEAGANQGVSELRKRIRVDLLNNISVFTQGSVIKAYVTNNDSLGLLRDYAYGAGQPQFVVSSGQATVAVSALNLNTAVSGNYNATIIVTANGNPSNPSGEIYLFPYKYTIDSIGTITRQTPNIQKRTRLLQGVFTLTVRRDTFAKYALFTSHHSTPSGTTVWFTNTTNFTGPVSTNTRFSFRNNPSGHFTEEASQHETKARFYNNGLTILLNADSNPPNDVPVFDNGFTRGADIMNLESSVSQADLKKEALGTLSNPGSNGIYVPNNGTILTGGVYIVGNSSVSMGLGTNNNPVYTITQGATTKIVTVDYANNQTKIQTGSVTETYQGIPDGESNIGTLIYAKDNINNFSGTVQKNTALTVSSERDIVITNHVQYQEYTSSPLSASGYNNLLGILSWGGNVRIGTSAPNNINIHGVVMAPHGVFTVDNYNSGSARGTATLLGGAITDFYGPFGTVSGAGYGRNFVYDARMLQGMAPPYFPYLTNFTSFDNGGLDNKLVWQDKGV